MMAIYLHGYKNNSYPIDWPSMHRSRTFRMASILTVAIWGLTEFPGVAQTIAVVRPSQWTKELEPWKTHRRTQGFEILEIDTSENAGAIQQQIRQWDKDHPNRLRAVVLVGDVGPLHDEAIGPPMFYHDSKALVRFGGDPRISTDCDYADLDDDGTPNVGVGRIPADTPDQLMQYIERVVDFESNRKATVERRDIHVIAGLGGFGAIADGAIELTTRQFLSQRIPGWANVTMTQANPTSPYCPDPDLFHRETLNRLNQGGLFFVYIGHGHVNTLDFLRVGERWLPIFSKEHVPKVQIANPPPIAIFLACYTGAIDAIDDSLSERLVLQPQGPIAAIAATRVSGPYGLAMLSNGLLAQCFESGSGSLGDMLAYAKRAMMTVAPSEPDKKRNDEMLNAIAQALSPEGYDLHAERQEHLWMMNLIGDPMLSVRLPSEIEIADLPTARLGQPLHVRGNVPFAGQLRLELVYRRDQNVPNLEKLDAFANDPETRQKAQKQYHLANDRVVVQVSFPVSQGAFEKELPVAQELGRGRYGVRAFLEGDGKWAAGYQQVSFR